MAPLLGKRKRRKEIDAESEAGSGSETEDAEALRARELLKSHFEAIYEPIPDLDVVAPANIAGREGSEDDDDEESEWDGMTDGEENIVQIIKHGDRKVEDDAVLQIEKKSFMSSRPPQSTSLNRPPNTDQTKKKSEMDIEDAEDESANLQKDLALQRLLKESHLLEGQASLEHVGKSRHKAFDLRLSELGSKTSIYTQKSMPMSQRQGIAAKASERADQRRREARENGIILEKVSKTKKHVEKRRERGIGGPSVGKFSGGTLNLSRRDINEIRGAKPAGKGRR